MNIAKQMPTINNETDYENALAEISRLLNHHRTPDETRHFTALLDAVELYEATHHPIPDPDPIEFLSYSMESRGLTEQDLVAYIGSVQRVRELLNRQCPLTLSMIRNLHNGLGISADALIQPYPVAMAA